MSAILADYVFYEIAALLALAAAAGVVGLVLRQPLIVAYIAVGVLAGPAALDIVSAEAEIDLLAELGIAVLLFLVGLKLDLSLVRTLGATASITGLGQVGFTAGIGFLIGLALGLDAVTSLYVAVALTFSSTIIIVKLLSDKREIDSLHGRIALGFLIVQDLVVVLAMIVLSALGVGAAAEGGAAEAMLRLALSSAAMLGFVILFVRFLATPLTTRLARAPELLLAFGVGWAALFAALGHGLGLGKEIGGLLAGVSLASTPYRDALAARLAPLRDFLLLFFFIALGAGLDFAGLGGALGPAVVLSLFVLIGNPLIVLAILGALGYRKRTGFLAGLTVAQISEFSLVFMAMGVALGHVSPEALGLVTLVGLATIAASTYMITWSHPLYERLEPLLGAFERRRPSAEEAMPATPAETCDVVIFGLGRYGLSLAETLRAAGRRVLGVDFDPEALRAARARGFDALYGDATDPELLAHLPLRGVDWAISATPEHDLGVTHDDPRRALLDGLRGAGFNGRVALTAHTPDRAAALRAAGADLVLTPFSDAADHAAALVLGKARPAEKPASLEAPEAQKELAS